MASNGYVLYEGPSLIDGKPIVMIATGFAGGGSSNRKTGAMIQTWILRSDIEPHEAIKSGEDASICGDCRHRGTGGKQRSCYVVVHQAPLSVYRAYKRGTYPRLPGIHVFNDRIVRLGAYGDPAGVPFEVLEGAVRNSAGHTGYTHQWSRCDARLRDLCMASCDSVDEHTAAANMGWRVFRTRDPAMEAAPRLPGEALCPASAEAGKKLTCEQCLACGGAGGQRRGHIVISAHGAAGFVSNYRKTFQSIPIVRAA